MRSSDHLQSAANMPRTESYSTALRLISHVEMDRIQFSSVHVRHVETRSMPISAPTSPTRTWSILKDRNGLDQTAYHANLDTAEDSWTSGIGLCITTWHFAVV
jgi:hypothetical protein